MDATYSLIITTGSKYYIANSPDFGISTLGHSIPEAIQMMRDAIICSEIIMKEKGRPIPEPGEMPVSSPDETIDFVVVDFDSDKLLQEAQDKKRNTISAWMNEEAAAQETCVSQDSLPQKACIIVCVQTFGECIIADFSDGSGRSLPYGLVSNEGHLKTVNIIKDGQAVLVNDKIEYSSSKIWALGNCR